MTVCELEAAIRRNVQAISDRQELTRDWGLGGAVVAVTPDPDFRITGTRLDRASLRELLVKLREFLAEP